MNWSSRLFDLALLSYPRRFRKRFGAEMRADFELSRRTPGTSGTPDTPSMPGTPGTLSTLGLLIVSGLKERATALHHALLVNGASPHLYVPDERPTMFWDTLRTDIRHTLRLAVKTPLFTMLTVSALGLGIGATTAIFAVVNGVLIRSLPYRDAERLVNVCSHATQEGRPRNPISPANFLDFQRVNSTLAGLEAYYTFVTPQELQTDAGSEVAFSVLVTPTLFDLLGRSADHAAHSKPAVRHGRGRPADVRRGPAAARRGGHGRCVCAGASRDAGGPAERPAMRVAPLPGLTMSLP
jgi:hypothetical protein